MRSIIRRSFAPVICIAALAACTSHSAQNEAATSQAVRPQPAAQKLQVEGTTWAAASKSSPIQKLNFDEDGVAHVTIGNTTFDGTYALRGEHTVVVHISGALGSPDVILMVKSDGRFHGTLFGQLVVLAKGAQ